MLIYSFGKRFKFEISPWAFLSPDVLARLCLGPSRTPPISLSTLRVETVSRPTCYGARYPPKPAPFLCSDRFPRRSDSGQTATRASGQGSLMLPRRIPSLSAADCGPSRLIMLLCAVVPLSHAVAALAAMPWPSTSDKFPCSAP
jgi:hypothetical protein